MLRDVKKLFGIRIRECITTKIFPTGRPNHNINEIYCILLTDKQTVPIT